MFKKAVKAQTYLRLGIQGPSGAGKTYSALAIATHLTDKRVALIDTEHGSASKYSDIYDFDVLELEAPFHPDRYVQAIRDAAEADYGVVVIDSLSHAWSGPGGLLEIVDDIAKRMKTSNSFAAWKDATPIQNRLLDSIVGAKIHVIATMRSKTEYVLEEDNRGKKVPRKVGMAPVQRDQVEYEFDIVAEMDHDHNLLVSKSRCPAVADAVVNKPGAEFADTLSRWLGTGEPMATDEQVAELRRRAAGISVRAATSMEQKIARRPTQAEADEWLAQLPEPTPPQAEAQESEEAATAGAAA